MSRITGWLFVAMLAFSLIAFSLLVPATTFQADHSGTSMGNMALVSASDSAPVFDAAHCRAIADLSAKNPPSFTAKENGEWECTYLLEYPETGHTPSLFIQVRGVEPGKWTSFRLKLNFGSLLSRQVLGMRAANLVYTLTGEQTPIRQLDAVLAEGREFELSFDTINLRYRQERMDTARFNLFGANTPKCVEPCR